VSPPPSSPRRALALAHASGCCHAQTGGHAQTGDRVPIGGRCHAQAGDPYQAGDRALVRIRVGGRTLSNVRASGSPLAGPKLARNITDMSHKHNIYQSAHNRNVANINKPTTGS
jgi:hypothetical protein